MVVLSIIRALSINFRVEKTSPILCCGFQRGRGYPFVYVGITDWAFNRQRLGLLMMTYLQEERRMKRGWGGEQGWWCVEMPFTSLPLLFLFSSSVTWNGCPSLHRINTRHLLSPRTWGTPPLSSSPRSLILLISLHFSSSFSWSLLLSLPYLFSLFLLSTFHSISLSLSDTHSLSLAFSTSLHTPPSLLHSFGGWLWWSRCVCGHACPRGRPAWPDKDWPTVPYSQRALCTLQKINNKLTNWFDLTFRFIKRYSLSNYLNVLFCWFQEFSPVSWQKCYKNESWQEKYNLETILIQAKFTLKYSRCLETSYTVYYHFSRSS